MIARALVCIPTYNNSGTILQVIKEALTESTLSVLVIDDGSSVPVLDLVNGNSEVRAHLNKRLTIHRQVHNMGKGVAIQTAFKLALKKGFTHMITMDGDAQHKASDLPHMLEAILTSPWALIIGKRKLEGEHVPGSSKFGRAFSNFWVKYQTDTTIEDSQSGFRSYPLFFVQHLKFFTKKYDFEIEVLIRLLWNKVDVIEVPIDVYYPPREERVSHFDKFRDNVKISLLNTVLVIVSLLKSNVSRAKIIISMMLGVFVGLLPIFGLHTPIAAFLSFIFRLNFPLMFLATNISIPPLIPVWAFISLKIGSTITNTPLTLSFNEGIIKHANEFFMVYFTGSVVLGILMSIIMGGVTFLLTMKAPKKKAWSGKSRGGGFGNFFMKIMTTHFGPKAAYFFLYLICPYFYLFAPKAVISHNQYFKILYPEVGFFRRQWLIIKTFFKLGQVLIDNIYSTQKDGNFFKLTRDGKENVPLALEKNRGHILVGSHVGGWMFAAKIFNTDKMEGLKIPGITVVEFNTGRGHNSQDKIQSSHLTFIQHSDESAIFKINAALGSNEVVILMGDRVVNHNIELVPFFGKLCAIDSTAFKIAVAKKAPISFTYGFKGTDMTYNLSITPPIYTEEILETKSKDAALLELIGHYTESLEEMMRKYPTQWFNFFPFWQALPSAESLAHAKKATHS